MVTVPHVLYTGIQRDRKRLSCGARKLIVSHPTERSTLSVVVAVVILLGYSRQFSQSMHGIQY